MSAVTNSTVYPNSSATIDKVSASSLWFMVTMIPSVIQAEIISVELISIIVAISPTVTNSVTLSSLLSASTWAASSSDFWRCESLFSRRYFAPFDLVVFPCNFSRVSRICFWISSSLGSSWVGWFGRFALGLFCGPPLGPVFFVIRLRRRLRSLLSALGFVSFFSNFLRSILSPAILSPVSFLYCVVTFSVSDVVVFSVSACFCSICFCGVELVAGSAACFSVFIGSASGDSVLSWASTFSFGFGFGSKSILPTWRRPLSSVRAWTTWVFVSCFSSIRWRIASFSLRLTSLTSSEASFLFRSVWKASTKSWYSAWEILDVGRASISNPCSPNCSTARSKEIFNSRRTLLIRMVLTSDICYIGIQK